MSNIVFFDMCLAKCTTVQANTRVEITRYQFFNTKNLTPNRIYRICRIYGILSADCSSGPTNLTHRSQDHGSSQTNSLK